MNGFFTEFGQIITAFLSNDAWEISNALGSAAAWPLGLIVMILGALVLLGLYKLIPPLDHHLERTVMVWTYLVIAGIIFVEVVRRFVFSEQSSWSTTLPPFLFLIMTWFGCAYNIQLRTHLSFAEFRANMGRSGQMFCLMLDAVLWLGFCWVVVVTSTRVAANSASNFQIMLGTDDVLQWWFLVSVPIAFTMMATRVLENVLQDIRNFRNGEKLIEQAVIGAD